MIRLIMEFPDGERKEIATLTTDGLSRSSFADHLDRVASTLRGMATGWRNRCHVDQQVEEIFAGLDLGPDA
jgi:hypothetical protein